MSVKIAGKQGKYGIIKHNPASAAADAFTAIGSTANQWTNPVLAATNFRTLYLTAMTPKIDPGVTVDNYNLTSQLGLNKELTNFFVDSLSGLAKFNFSAPADRNTLVALLVAAMQSVTTVANEASSYTSTIISGFKAGTIDFKAGGGYTFGVCEKIGASADDGVLLQNGIMDSLTLTIDFPSKGIGRLASISGTMAFKSVAFDQTLTGTFVETTMTPYNNSDLFAVKTFTSDSVDLSTLCIRRIEITINNNVTSNCATTAGAANQYDCSPTYLINIIVDHTDLTEKLRNDFKLGATVDFNISNGADGTVAGYLEIDAPYCKMISEPSVYNGDFYGYSLQLEAYQNSTTSPLTFIIHSVLNWAFNIV